jgi:predicted dehydrogenase
MIRGGEIGEISFVRTWNYSNQFPEGIGNPPDSEPPAELDWDMWLGPAPQRPFNKNRFGVNPNRFSDFRWFWDYAGGMMTDWGIHLLDIVLWAMDEPGPRVISTVGGKYVIDDNRDTPDTILATYEFPGFACTYENRIANGQSMFGKNYGILFHGTQGTMYVNRQGWEITPETERIPTGTRNRMPAASGEAGNNSTDGHWANFVNSMKTREKPISDILEGHRSTTTALLGNISLRSNQRVDWDPIAETTTNQEAQSFLRREYRAPWKLEL